MKRILVVIAVLLLLCGCAAAPELCGVWVNAGQYTAGREFVETLTLNEDGSALVHLDYRGKDYATLEGTYRARDGVLSVDFADPNTRDRTYTYTVTDTTLTLEGDGKTVEYVRNR